MGDPQVIASSKIGPRESLLDKILQQYDIEGKDPAYPFKMRLILCGNNGKSFSPSSLESISVDGAMKADLTNPFTSSSVNPASCSSIVVLYGDHFVQVIEGDERHIYFYVSELCSQIEKCDVSNVRIIFFDDDVDSGAFGWITLDKLPPIALGGEGVTEKNEDEIADYVSKDISNLAEMSGLASSRKLHFIENAKADYPKLFPKSEYVRLYIQTSVFLTLEEFKDNFCKFPDLVREVEVNHPSEAPLKY